MLRQPPSNPGNHVYVLTPTHQVEGADGVPGRGRTGRSFADEDRDFHRRFAALHGHGDSARHRAYLAVVGFGVLIIFALVTRQHQLQHPTRDGQRGDGKDPRSQRQFKYSDKRSPYEEIWVGDRLPRWAWKRAEYREVEGDVTPDERICFVHVGKAGGSSVGCALGFRLHCEDGEGNRRRVEVPGLLPRRATRMFHADAYDCHDDSAYFLFVVRDPVERIKSAFLYDRPNSEHWLRENFPRYYERRKSYYLDCPFGLMDQMVYMGLHPQGLASEVCRKRAAAAMRGDLHFSCHMYFNYQFHLEGIPDGAKVLVIRNEHLVDDWNSVERYIGGEPNVLSNTTIPVMNKSNKDSDDKWLSPKAQQIVCRMLCNEIVAYKQILRRSLNLNYMEVERSMEELKETCPKYSQYDRGDCDEPYPNIREKLIEHRGYEHIQLDRVRDMHNADLENSIHGKKWLGEHDGLMDDDGFQLT